MIKLGQKSLAQIVDEMSSSLKKLPEIDLNESPTITDYADALPAVLFYARITGKVKSANQLGKFIGMTPSHISRALNRELPEQSSIKGHRENPYVSIYKSAMRALELPESIDPRILTRSLYILTKSMVEIVHGAACIELDKEHARILDKYRSIQTQGTKIVGPIGIYLGLVAWMIK